MGILDYRLYYFLGVGGIGMSALARYFNHYGKKVFGYDRTRTELTAQLEAEGISCHYSEDPELLKDLCGLFKKQDVLVIHTPAVPASHEELRYLAEQGYLIKKRSEVLGEITGHFRTIAIAGTHGKTTTTTMVTHILKCAGINCFSFMGGISGNYRSNILLGDANDTNAWVVVEADEYDRSFLTLSPEIGVITSVDADHLDIYGSGDSVKESYSLFANRLRENGILIVKKNVDNELRLSSARLIYSLNLNTDYCAQSVRIDKGHFVYDVKSPVAPVHQVTLGLPGLHNVENSIAAVAVAQQLGVNEEVIRDALRSFKGVKRRFDYRVLSDDLVFIDDYAHHPEELKATIGSVRQLFPGKRITGVFQPHLFSRTRDFAEQFAESLDMLDECILLDIYPARELPIEGVSSQMLLTLMKCRDKKVLSKEQVLERVKLCRPEVLLTMGAGDIDGLVKPLEEILKHKN